MGDFDDREIAEQLARHDKVLQDYRSRFEEHKQWLYSTVNSSGSPVGGEPSADLVSPGRPLAGATHTPAQPSHAARSEHRDPSPERSYLQEDERMRQQSAAAQQREAAAAAAQVQSHEQSQQAYFRRANPKVKGHPLRVYDRVTQWQRRREQHLSEMRQQREQQELTSCTFTPTVRNASSSSQRGGGQRSSVWESAPSSNIYGGDGKAWGFHEFVERQREARRRSKEGNDTAFCTGKKWKNEITVPQEFNLGRRDRAIRSLQKPLSPPACVASVHEHHHLAQEISAGLPKDSPLQQLQDQGGGLPRSGLFSERISAKIIDHAMMSQSTADPAAPAPAEMHDDGSRQHSGHMQQGHFSSQYGHFGGGSSQGSPGFR